MDLNDVRGRFHKSIKPFTAFLIRHGIRPNVVTSASLIFMIPASYFLLNHEDELFISLFMVVAFLDALDGAVAENENAKTKFGAFYDAFTDRIIEGILYLCIAMAYENLMPLSFVTLILSYMVSYTAAWHKELKKIGVGKRAYRLIVFIIAFLMHQLFYGLLIISILAAITIAQRLYYVVRNYKEL
ncbi:MAG: CDP-alcohol phosphatidyltransferase family protein [Thermoplasmata archaeon]|nr:MAG: CDP-alcohol phosphatidyltransferase family protein [Thermoplasmata archaeon]